MAKAVLVPKKDSAVCSRGRWQGSRDAFKSQESESQSLSTYLAEIARQPLLTKDEEIQLAQAIARGDAGAREKMASSNLRLVVSMARRYLGAGLALVDLIQEGNLGLLEAVDKFDVKKNCRFSTYACWWIRQAMTRAIANKSRTVRLPVHLHDLVQKYQRLTSQAISARDQQWSLTEACKILLPMEAKEAKKSTKHMSPESKQRHLEDLQKTAERKLRHLLTSSMEPLSLEAPIHAESQELSLAEVVPASRCEFREACARQEWQDVLSYLSAKELRIVYCRYGLGGENEKTLNELALEYGVSRESIRQIELKAIQKLRDAAAREGFYPN